MTPGERDPAYLWDMLTYARQALELVSGLQLKDYLADRVRQLALERSIEVIGEAARQVSADFQSRHPEIPWRPIMAQRHVLAHDYGEIDQEKIWRVATVHVPELVSRLEPLIPPVPGD